MSNAANGGWVGTAKDLDISPDARRHQLLHVKGRALTKRVAILGHPFVTRPVGPNRASIRASAGNYYVCWTSETFP